jgi:hypothetical protein
MVPTKSLIPTRPLAGLLLAAAFLAGACTDASQTSIEISQALLSSDELQPPAPGQVCSYAPQTQLGGFYKPSGSLELSPQANPNPEYFLVIQMENYLDATAITDSNGNTIVNGNRNDFHVESFTVNYLDVQGNLGAINPQTVTPLTSAVVRPGGTQAATAVGVNMLPLAAVTSIIAAMNAHQATLAGLVLEIQGNGRLGSGEPISSGIFRFPVTLTLTTTMPGMANGSNACPAFKSPVATGFGPCCANQDYGVVCAPCGGFNQTCCGGIFGTCTGLTPDGGATSCLQDVLIPTGQENCGYVATPFAHCR